MSIETLLYEEIESEFNKLYDMAPGSDEHKVVVDEVTKLMDRAIEIERIESDAKEKKEARISETTLKQQEMKEERKDRIVKNSIDIAGIILPLVVTIWGTSVALKFEEEGTFTTMIGRGFINKLIPKK